MRPLVVFSYRLENLWTEPARAASDAPPQLENTSPADAFDIVISSIAVDHRRRYHFDPVPALPSHGSWPLVVTPTEPSLAAAISQSVVEDVLAGRPPVTRWPVRIAYRDEEGRPYATCCEIRVVQLPLAIETAVTLTGEGPTSSGPSSARSRARLAATPR